MTDRAPDFESADGDGSSDRSKAAEIVKAFHEETVTGKAYDARSLMRLWRFVRPYRWLFSLSLALVVLTSCAALLRPLVMRYALDAGVSSANRQALYRAGALLVGIGLVEQVLGFGRVYAMHVVGARAMASLRSHAFEFLQSLGMSFFDRQPVGRLVTRITNDVDAIYELFTSGALNALGDVVRLLGIVVLMLALDWKLALIAFAAVPPVVLLVLVVRTKARRASRDYQGMTARLNATMNEQIAGVAVIQAFNREDAAAREFDDLNRGHRDLVTRSYKYEAVQAAAIEMMAAVCLASIVLSLGYRSVSFGTLVAFNAYLIQFFEPINALAQRYGVLQSAMAGAERVFGLLDTPSSDVDAIGVSNAAHGDSKLALELDHVSFEYRLGLPVLSDVVLSARTGEKIALVGPSGAGKTTIASLVLRLYDPTRGVVRVHGRDVRSFERGELRRQFSVVPQDVVLFPGTVLSNIAQGENPERGRAEAVLQRINALGLFSSRPGGLDAPVDGDGATFSAGERQLIAFARALYRDSPIVLLDEATASVDSITEARLQHALEELLRERTALIIAHRLSTIHRADRIIIMQNGRVVDSGTHHQLLSRGGLYAQLHALQSAREELVPNAVSATTS